MTESSRLTAIAAVAGNGVIGLAGQLPWQISEDMRHFREVTMGEALVMGRNTYLSLGGPLAGRAIFVVSPPELAGDDFEADLSGLPTSVAWRHGLVEAIESARATGREVFIAGGAMVYDQAWPLLTDLDLTLVDDEPEGDAFFPVVDETEWLETGRDNHDGFAFVHYRRRDWQ